MSGAAPAPGSQARQDEVEPAVPRKKHDPVSIRTIVVVPADATLFAIDSEPYCIAAKAEAGFAATGQQVGASSLLHSGYAAEGTQGGRT